MILNSLERVEKVAAPNDIYIIELKYVFGSACVRDYVHDYDFQEYNPSDKYKVTGISEYKKGDQVSINVINKANGRSL